MQLKKYFALLSLTLSLTLLLSCNSSPKEDQSTGMTTTETTKLKIAVIPKGSTHSFWKSIHAGAAKAAQEKGVEIIWQGPQKEDDRQMQIQVVQNFISRGVDGIVLAPLDDRSLATPVSSAVKRNIPVVIIDSGLQSEEYSSFVATDNKQGGKLCAKRLAELLNGKGKVIMLRYQEGSASTAEREAGFLEGMKEYGPTIELISTNQYAGATMEKAFQASQNLLNRFAEVDGIYCPNESSTQGMLRALQTSGRAKKVKFVGFDSNDALIAGINNGEIHGLAVQNPFKMGYEGVLTVVAVLKKEPYEKKVDTGVMLVTGENINTPEVKELLNPDLAKWLNE
ncbi:ABC transporter substrate-binding protein [Rhodocytophaga rosea]|uniref:ABC transporter substrate-binding protein n=1 Tax=Rhodocytophaga rosea TaxID=2704465 RepID=A0A6C0GHY0_9BACT|nr:substrate-binding domain-containing protein [Rhodocytophaga rosea]QHT67505.1 ABC transporter substrate-binding protein [Rhodocytophaga rosea]